MSYTRLNADDELAQRRSTFLPGLGRVTRVLIWSVLNACLLFAEQLAELCAPLLLLAGVVWWAIPRALAAVTLDGQAGDMLQMVRARFPHDIYLNGDYYSAGTLITDGIWLIAVVAVCRTLSAALASLLLDRR
jgi:hypothetical protein